jgi:hypothetical protein
MLGISQRRYGYVRQIANIHRANARFAGCGKKCALLFDTLCKVQ